MGGRIGGTCGRLAGGLVGLLAGQLGGRLVRSAVDRPVRGPVNGRAPSGRVIRTGSRTGWRPRRWATAGRRDDESERRMQKFSTGRCWHGKSREESGPGARARKPGERRRESEKTAFLAKCQQGNNPLSAPRIGCSSANALKRVRRGSIPKCFVTERRDTDAMVLARVAQLHANTAGARRVAARLGPSSRLERVALWRVVLRRAVLRSTAFLPRISARALLPTYPDTRPPSRTRATKRASTSRT